MSAQITPLDRIHIIKEKYDSILPDYVNVDELQYWAQKLSTALVDYSVEVGNLSKLEAATEFAWKAAFEKKRAQYTIDGLSVSAAEAKAKAEVSEELQGKIYAHADFTAAEIQYKAAMLMHGTMTQHIATIKATRRLEMTGQTSAS